MGVRKFGLFLMTAAVAAVCAAFLFWPASRGRALAQQNPPNSEPPRGVEVQARGPIHEAFATPTAEPKPTYGVPKKPPAPIEELPPDEKPEGDAVWIGGYWAWDDDRGDFLWVSGCWRIQPAGREWVPGYWREVGAQHQWVPGFWTAVQNQRQQDVTYYPEPPPPPQVAPPPAPPEPDMFYVPGYWMWTGDHYVWRAGYHTRVRPGHVYVASHYRWTPYGYVYVAGYWDLAISRRGVLYAPVVVDTVVVGPRFVYTPYYAVSDGIIVDAFFVRPGFCHYYFGDYYGPRYASIGFECGFHYSRRYYEPVVVYHRWEYRDRPGWYDTRLSITIARNAGRAPVPPRTLVQQNNITVINKTTNVYNTTVLAPTKNVVQARGAKTVALDTNTRTQVRAAAVNHQMSVIKERAKTESTVHATPLSKQPRTTSLTMPERTGRAAKSGSDVGLSPPVTRGPDRSRSTKDTNEPKFKGASALKATDAPKTTVAPNPQTPPSVKSSEKTSPRPTPSRTAPTKKSSGEKQKKSG